MAPVTRACLLLALATTTLSSSAWAQERAQDASPDQIRAAQAERLRREIGNQIQLQANDLIDELVFSWLESPPFANATPVVLADVITPLGFGSGLEALLENHLSQVLVKNPDANVRLSHCPSCHALLVHSDAKSTVLSRGIDQPETLEKLRAGSGADYALFLDFEAEGTELVMRARITQLKDPLPIVYARTLSTKTASAPMLRSGARLKSSEDARKEYVDILEQQGPISIPVRLAMNAFAPNEDQAIETPIPVPWLQVGAEYAITSARAWTGSLVVGATFLPTLQTGGMVQVRAARLITGSSLSLTRPNVYFFVGGSLALLQGQTASLITPPSTDQPTDAFGPVATYLSFQSGLEVRVSKRIGASLVIETMPNLYESNTIGNYLDMLDTGIAFGWVQINSIGVEATFAF